MINKDINRLIELYLKDIITYEELLQHMERLDKKDKPDMPEPPRVY